MHTKTVAEIIHLSRDQLYPRFGYALTSKQRVYVREDLPGCVKNFVTIHECYHLQDQANWWVVREIKANVAGAVRHPVGFIVCLLMSLAPYRLSYYGRRIIGRES